MITVATMLWRPNEGSRSFSQCYTPEWVDRLYRGFARNLMQPFEFVCFTDRAYRFSEPVEQMAIETDRPDYGCYIEPFRLDVPMILVGLDTVVIGNCDQLADYCLHETTLALPRAVYRPNTACNGVALIPAGHRHVYDSWRGENDMAWLRRQRYALIDDLFPGQVASYKGHVKEHGLDGVSICFFHGEEKPHELEPGEPVLEHWQ